MGLKEIAQAVIDGDDVQARDLTRAALQDNLAPSRIIEEGLNEGMSVVGQPFKAEQIYVAEVLMAARAMQAGLEVLEPLLTQSPVQAKGTAVVGTVYEDLHDIGKNLVLMLLRGTGLRVIDLGKNVPPQRFVECVKETKADVLAMSCLLTTTMISMKKTMEALKEAGLREQVKVIVGGQPITQRFADQIGADAYAPSAGEAVDVVKGLLGLAAGASREAKLAEVSSPFGC